MPQRRDFAIRACSTNTALGFRQGNALEDSLGSQQLVLRDRAWTRPEDRSRRRPAKPRCPAGDNQQFSSLTEEQVFRFLDLDFRQQGQRRNHPLVLTL